MPRPPLIPRPDSVTPRLSRLTCHASLGDVGDLVLEVTSFVIATELAQ
jgi:hypothetical protein